MSHREHTEREEDTPHNTVFSAWSPEELYELCNSAAAKACSKHGYSGEREDVAHELWIYLRERGHVVRRPEHKGAIFNFLTKLGRDLLRGRWNYDKRHTSFDRADSDRVGLSAERILEGVAAGELWAQIEHQARGTQIEIIKGLSSGATRTEVAAGCGVKPYQIRRLVAALRQRIR
jgi:hypothetical protein